MSRLKPTRTRPGQNRRKRTPDTRPVNGQAPTLTGQQENFIHEYDGNGGNGTRAYMSTHPKCSSIGTAAVEAHRYLRNPKIRTVLDALRSARWKRLQMDGDEALARVALDARADLRELFDEKGQMLNPSLWPDSVAQSVKSIKPGPFGISITLNDGLAARRIILEQTGRLKTPLAGVGDLARILAGDFKEGE